MHARRRCREATHRARRASERSRPRKQATAFFTPDRDRTCVCRSPPHVTRRRSTSPALRAPRILENTRPLSARFSLYEGEEHATSEGAGPAVPQAPGGLLRDPEENAGLLHVQRRL